MYNLRSAVADLDPSDALEFALEAYEHIAGQDLPIEVLIAGVHLSPRERLIFGILYANLGELVQYDRVYAVVDHGYENGMCRRTFLTHISTMRSKLKGQYTIRSLYKIGIVMEWCGE